MALRSLATLPDRVRTLIVTFATGNEGDCGLLHSVIPYISRSFHRTFQSSLQLWKHVLLSRFRDIKPKDLSTMAVEDLKSLYRTRHEYSSFFLKDYKARLRSSDSVQLNIFLQKFFTNDFESFASIIHDRCERPSRLLLSSLQNYDTFGSLGGFPWTDFATEALVSIIRDSYNTPEPIVLLALQLIESGIGWNFQRTLFLKQGFAIACMPHFVPQKRDVRSLERTQRLERIRNACSATLESFHDSYSETREQPTLERQFAPIINTIAEGEDGFIGMVKQRVIFADDPTGKSVTDQELEAEENRGRQTQVRYYLSLTLEDKVFATWEETERNNNLEYYHPGSFSGIRKLLRKPYPSFIILESDLCSEGVCLKSLLDLTAAIIPLADCEEISEYVAELMGQLEDLLDDSDPEVVVSVAQALAVLSSDELDSDAVWEVLELMMDKTEEFVRHEFEMPAEYSQQQIKLTSERCASRLFAACVKFFENMHRRVNSDDFFEFVGRVVEAKPGLPCLFESLENLVAKLLQDEEYINRRVITSLTSRHIIKNCAYMAMRGLALTCPDVSVNEEGRRALRASAKKLKTSVVDVKTCSSMVRLLSDAMEVTEMAAIKEAQSTPFADVEILRICCFIYECCSRFYFPHRNRSFDSAGIRLDSFSVSLKHQAGREINQHPHGLIVFTCTLLERLFSVSMSPKHRFVLPEDAAAKKQALELMKILLELLPSLSEIPRFDFPQSVNPDAPIMTCIIKYLYRDYRPLCKPFILRGTQFLSQILSFPTKLASIDERIVNGPFEDHRRGRFSLADIERHSLIEEQDFVSVSMYGSFLRTWATEEFKFQKGRSRIKVPACQSMASEEISNAFNSIAEQMKLFFSESNKKLQPACTASVVRVISSCLIQTPTTDVPRRPEAAQEWAKRHILPSFLTALESLHSGVHIINAFSDALNQDHIPFDQYQEILQAFKIIALARPQLFKKGYEQKLWCRIRDTYSSSQALAKKESLDDGFAAQVYLLWTETLADIDAAISGGIQNQKRARAEKQLRAAADKIPFKRHKEKHLYDEDDPEPYLRHLRKSWAMPDDDDDDEEEEEEEEEEEDQEDIGDGSEEEEEEDEGDTDDE